MAGNRSLDEFAGTRPEDGREEDEPEARTDVTGDEGAEPAAVEETAGGLDPAAGADAEAPESAIEPAAPVFASSPGGEPCPACGETVERRWRDGDVLVCDRCKAW